MLTEEEIDHIADRVAARLVRYGLDAKNPLDMQQDFAFLRSQREASENLAANAKRTLTYGAVMAFVGGVSFIIGRVIVSVLRGT